MNSLSLIVENIKADTQLKEVECDGILIPIYGHLICTGESHRMIVYFVDRQHTFLPSKYIEEHKLAVKFVSHKEMDGYFMLTKIKEPVYAYLNTVHPELNCLSVNEPVRETYYQLAH
ncbi:hypothetical protein OOZ15_05710 [Galbibacter sp. EGI 63066]|uniref:hypothetical protein n=1 Tax=Galbibacter sp. EGI 63066 TaxID=2993559 RepID=UPI0022494DE1|nr:hypothetical protein [Galbibacter sp. EGI 63066]MCX2679433.1 hypothetical protein [Galbibacter sp. EGI 63066]